MSSMTPSCHGGLELSSYIAFYGSFFGHSPPPEPCLEYFNRPSKTINLALNFGKRAQSKKDFTEKTQKQQLCPRNFPTRFMDTALPNYLHYISLYFPHWT